MLLVSLMDQYETAVLIQEHTCSSRIHIITLPFSAASLGWPWNRKQTACDIHIALRSFNACMTHWNAHFRRSGLVFQSIHLFQQCLGATLLQYAYGWSSLECSEKETCWLFAFKLALNEWVNLLYINRWTKATILTLAIDACLLGLTVVFDFDRGAGHQQRTDWHSDSLLRSFFVVVAVVCLLQGENTHRTAQVGSARTCLMWLANKSSI